MLETHQGVRSPDAAGDAGLQLGSRPASGDDARHPVNSRPYWNTRFKDDWDARGGAGQSRFFSRLAIDAMPPWLCRLARREGLSVCDWGCALGDGTDELARQLGWDVTGVDFSEQAVAQAAQRFPALRFVCEDWLEQPPRPAFDIVFSSNTLEHFGLPWRVFDALAAHAARYVILLVPYCEYLRHPEHAATFDDDSILLAPNAHWTLLQRTVIDAAARDPAHWNGRQVLLLYARGTELARRRLSLADVGWAAVRAQHGSCGALFAQHAELAELRARRQREDELARQIDAQRATHEAREADLVAAVADRQAAVASVQARLDALRTSRSWRVTAPLRLAGRVGRRIAARCSDVRRAYGRAGMSEVVARSVGVALRRLASASTRKARWAAVDDPERGAASTLRAPRDGFADVYVFAVIDWRFRIQRPQHIAREMALRGHRVFYLSNHFRDAARPGYGIEPMDASLPLYQVSLNARGAPPIYFGAADDAVADQLDAGLRRLGADAGGHPVVAVVQHPFWARLAASRQATCLVYDCMDDHEGFGGVPRELLELERWIMRRADLVVATSEVLAQRARRDNAQVAVVRNAGAYADFCRAPSTVFADPRHRGIIGYYGAIAEWFDVDLVRRVACAFPDALVVLVGADSAGVAAQLRDLPNVRCEGEVAYSELPRYVHAFDVCLLAFKVTQLTLATNPVKIYEYLSAGRAVVAVELPEMAQFGDLVRTAGDHDGFVAAVRAALDEAPPDPDTVRRRQAFAAGQTWSHRARELDAAIAALPRPRVSVVVLTHGNLALTRDCLASLERCREGVELEVIVVDNASTDGTPEFLSAWAAGRGDARVILNAANLGFAAGNNVGLAAAGGDYLVILNNDTVVTPWWAWRLVGHLRNEPAIGVIGALTNNIGNEARVATTYASLDAMPAQAERITRPNVGRWFALHTAAFFCVMLPRTTYERCGPLCEDYGVGMFEDDDYCRRVQQAGLVVACAEDVFVHHHLSASFDRLGEARKRELFETNQAIYESKWGRWTPHVYRARVRSADGRGR